MKNRSACLLANYGMVVAVVNLEKTMWAAAELETLAKQYYLASCPGKMNILPEEEIDAVLAKISNNRPKGLERILHLYLHATSENCFPP